ncbi:hypothetical protein EVAR_96228_1 [Eumeta japonica]|uniref:Uncharacterized protein n=1 Tax=Eumeta variegata TaxID=151549 RepID=A0A4C1WMB8_EUMVA|nr:hypothetical protein EVAR_96228_1 [Eumeta japonica]
MHGTGRWPIDFYRIPPKYFIASFAIASSKAEWSLTQVNHPQASVKGIKILRVSLQNYTYESIIPPRLTPHRLPLVAGGPTGGPPTTTISNRIVLESVSYSTSRPCLKPTLTREVNERWYRRYENVLGEEMKRSKEIVCHKSVHMGGGDHLVCGSSHARLTLKDYIKKVEKYTSQQSNRFTYAAPPMWSQVIPR